ncbi:peptide ABC transporter substrate-binding protein [Sphingosinicella soli]|uniref:ABC-type oligopeptide transport system substrate-binding subunit n=1 Tax=Sphingosinicella soli TaxID=333708 RepID=A0A7W7B6L5_9SPHN|nr:peptide ABC transporter substrate-binding protein [Sphingosinicella soli]MBB4633842.1 ABC-type oligopeptide transport system substrate-binding subunit [Sphingosinicella soli]
MTRLSWISGCLAFALLALGGCERSADDDSESRLRMAFVTDDGASLVPDDGREKAAARAMHIGLTTLEPSGRVVPSLALSWRVSDDGLTYVFKLREAYWADGRRLTSGDVVAVIRRIVSPGSANPLRDELMMIKNAALIAANRRPARMLGVTDPRPDTVVVTLAKPEPALLQLLADPAAAIVRAGKSPPASGAFAKADEPEDAAGTLLLVKNSTYYAADTVSLAGAELSRLEAESAIRRFSAGELDIVSGGRLAGLRAARSSDSRALRLEPTWGLYFYLARTSAGPLADVRVRRALAMSFDRAAILSRLFGVAGLQASYSALPPTLPDAYAGSAGDWAGWTPDARESEAVRLLAEAGYTFDQPLTLSVAIPHGREHADLLAAISNSWAAIGVRVKAYARGPLSHRRAIEKGDFELAVVERIARAPIADTFLQPFTCAVRLGGYCNPAVDQLLADAATEDDPGTRIQLQRRANRIISEDAPLIAVLSPIRWSLVSPRVTGWENNVAGAHPLSGLALTGTNKE